MRPQEEMKRQPIQQRIELKLIEEFHRFLIKTFYDMKSDKIDFVKFK